MFKAKLIERKPDGRQRATAYVIELYEGPTCIMRTRIIHDKKEAQRLHKALSEKLK